MEGTPFFGPDFSPLAETPPPPPEKRPEIIKDDDDDDVEEDKPKTLLDYLKKDPEEDSKEKIEKEEPAEAEPETEEPEGASEDEEPEAAAEIEPEDGVEPESEAGSQELTNEEEQIAATEIITTREEEVRDELAAAKTAEEENEALAAGVFLDTANQEIQNGQTVDEAIETGEERAKETLGIEPDESPEGPEVKEELPAEPEVTEPAEPDLPEEDDAAAAAAGAAGTTPPVAIPPFPPNGPGGVGGPGGPGAAGGNVLPALPNIAPNPSPAVESNRRVNTGGAVLAGGLVGYLLGRRRGRIKTEKKLLPVQHRLEKEIADLHGKIAWKEAAVRSLAREQIAANPETVEKTAERLKAAKEQDKPKLEKTAEQKPESLSAETIHTERLGKFAVDAERPSQSEAYRAPERLKPIDLMTVPELLAVAERIEIERSTVRKLYEANRINYEGLRRIVRAYLRGERYDRIITDNLLTVEKYAYPETLQRHATSDTSTYGGGLDQSGVSAPPPAFNQQSHAEPHANPLDTFVQPQTANGSKHAQSSIITAGVVIAIIILVFILAR